ncbi:mesoderm posterior protein 1-like [Strigops habroptila]|uniref:Mesoderm posterior protein 1-like n=1 Tax=Strigops habroptila TaxID=2489341 RepID=A0A672U2J9_STRHB|nr:mesoderm posterior protein 1-like [Strigops habroptila]
MAAPGLPLPPTALLQQWGCRGPRDPEGYSSSSPAPSPDSCGPSSPAAARGPRHGPAAPRGPRGRKGARGAGSPRQSASEREKLRMRRLAQALLRLRHYLPPALAPAGQSLTKIETLRLAARYIAHLSALLGLSEEALARRRGAAPRHCPLCPQGLGCCRSPDPRPRPPAPAPRDASPPGAAGWGSAPMAGTPPEVLGAAAMGTGAWASSPPCGAAPGAPPEVLGVPDMGMGAWGSPPYIPSMGTPQELHGAVASNTCSWPSPLHRTGALLDLPGDPLLDAGLMLPEFVDAGTVTQDLSADLLSLLEALLPPQCQD